jgi:tRNA A-37 threonylcarbamoyl transferase component Bud32
MCEEFQGRFAEPRDYCECRRSLQQLHSCGAVHGDLNKFNIIITTDGVRFIDLGKSILDTDEGVSKDKFSRLQQELYGLEKALNNIDGWENPD